MGEWGVGTRVKLLPVSPEAMVNFKRWKKIWTKLEELLKAAAVPNATRKWHRFPSYLWFFDFMRTISKEWNNSSFVEKVKFCWILKPNQGSLELLVGTICGTLWTAALKVSTTILKLLESDWLALSLWCAVMVTTPLFVDGLTRSGSSLKPGSPSPN
jgi:hypothetical protein